MPKDDTERAGECGRRGEWEDDPAAPSALECLRAAGFTREASARALPATLALSAASDMDLGKAARVATKMVILMRKIEMVQTNHHLITFVP